VSKYYYYDHKPPSEAAESGAEGSAINGSNLSTNNQQKFQKYQVTSHMCRYDGCERFFYKTPEMFEHMKQDHGILQFLCSAVGCGKSFALGEELTNHVAADHSNANWPCVECHQVEDSDRSLYYHMILYHYEGIVKCCYPNCSYIANTRIKVYDHYDTHPPPSQVSTDQNHTIASASQGII